MKLKNILRSFAAALTLATAAHASAAVTPKNGATVDLLTENQKTCVSLSTSKRGTWLYNNPTIAQTLTDASPLVISWDGDSGNCSVTVTESATGKVYLQTTAKSPVDCYNLRAGYDYQLKIKGSSIDSTTTFKTSATAPRVIWCNRLFYPPSGDNRVGVPNFRDLGGYKGLGGKRVRQGLIYRSAAFNEKAGGASAVNDTVRAFAIDQLGIKTDIDLREDGENYPDMSTSPLGKSVNYYNFPSTAYSLKKNGSYMQAAKVLFDKTKLPAVFHCQGGRDRGGTLPVPILALLGVSEADIYLDYMFTGTSLNMPPRSDPGKFVNVLNAIKAMSGSTLAEQAAAFFKQSGFTDAEITAFRAMMLEDGTEEEATTHTHSWSDWTVTKEATCTENGSRERTCSADDCPYGGKQTETIEALGHQWGAWTEIREKTEELPGLEQRTCSRCKATEQRETGRIVPTELPDAYTACTWVGSSATGKQWFDTKLVAADFTHVSVDFEFTAWGGDDVSALVGARWVDTSDKTTNNQIIVAVNASAAWFGGQGTYSAGSPAEKAFEGLTAAKLNTRYSLKNRADGSHIYLGNGSTTNDLKLKNGHYEGAATLGIFAMNDTQANKVWRHASAKIYSLQIYNGRWTSEKAAELVRNYIPCQRNADGVYGFYDMITGDFAVSASSDAFIGEGGSAATHTHVWSDWVVTTEATCAEAGEKTRTCSADGCTVGTQTEAIPATGAHDYYWVIDKEATETEAGHKHQQCNVCEGWGAEEDIPATGGGSGDDDDPVAGDITPLPSTAIVCIGDSLTQGHKGRGIVAGDCPANYCGGLLAGATCKISKAYPYYLSLLVDSKRDVYNVSRGSATTGMMLASMLPGEPKITKDLVFTSSSRTVELTDKDTKFELKGLDTGAAIPVISTSEKMVDVGRQAMVGTFANGVRARFNQFTAKIQSDVEGTERRWVEIVGDVTGTVTVPSGTAFTTDVSKMCDNTILILHLGANDISTTYNISHEVYVQQMKDYLDAHCKTGRYIVMSSATDSGKASMAHFASEFGDHFINLKSVLDSEGMAIAKAKGLFAQDSTVEWDASDSAGLLAGDRLHYNDYGNQVVAQIVYNKLDALGYLSDAPVHTHTYGEWIIDTEATATTAGSKHRVCSCGDIEYATIPATGGEDPVDPPSSGYVPVKPTPYAANTIVCIGDSLTGGEKACEKVSSATLPANYCPDVFAGKTVSDVFKTYPCYLAERVGAGFNVENVARGGAETAQMIGLMTPGLPLTRNAFTLGPTSNKVSFSSNIGVWDSKYGNKYYLNTSSVPVGDSFAAGAGKYTVIGDFGGILRARYSCVSEGSCAAAFVDGPDANVTVPAGTPFTSDVSLMCSNTIQVILLGANDGLANYTDWVGIIKNYVNSGVTSGKYVVLSPHATTKYSNLRSDELEAYMAQQFGEHYVNLYAELNTNGMARAKAKGYVAADSTVAWNTADGLLSTDELHFNDAGKKVLADIVYDKLNALGYLSGGDEPVHTHVYGEWIIDTPATATTAGSKHRVCECGDIEYATIPATGGGDEPGEDPVPGTPFAVSWGYSTALTDGSTVLVFTNVTETMNWQVPEGVTSVRYLVVAGGGAGGNRAGGGGGAGGLLAGDALAVTPGGTLAITVGKGGVGTNGCDSSIGANIVAVGGGMGGLSNSDAVVCSGRAGGSGGGANGYSSKAAGGAGTEGQGFAGGLGIGRSAAGGGGGAGGAGGNAPCNDSNKTGAVGGQGGAGVTDDITGVAVAYAGGGGGGGNVVENLAPTNGVAASNGGYAVAGGGRGGVDNAAAVAGTDGRGGGGGGGAYTTYATGAKGGDGVVILRFTTGGGETPVDPTPVTDAAWGWSNQVTIAGTDYCVLAFTNTATAGFAWTVPSGVTAIDYLVVGGGSGGAQSESDGTRATNGGHAGTFVESVASVTAGTTLQVVVGAGGASGEAGGASSLGAIATAAGGASVDGFAVGSSYGGYGGDGAGGDGEIIVNTKVGGAGGAGKVSSITGVETWYAAGGGGGKGGDGGSGIGGDGGAGGSSSGTGESGTPGLANTGSGGGGAGRYCPANGNLGAGGSGIVIVRYAVPDEEEQPEDPTPEEPMPVTDETWGWSNRVTIAGADCCVLAFTNTAAAGFAWTVPSDVTAIDYLVVGGGSGGAQSTADGTRATHGGNAGAFVESTASYAVTAGTTLRIVVGAGGAASEAGGASSLGAIATAAGGAAVTGYAAGSSVGGNGGNGAGGDGVAVTNNYGGAGGVGLASGITGEIKWYAAGGAGGAGKSGDVYRGVGGSGIGGNGGAAGGSDGTGCSGESGLAGTGSGGGGCGRRTAKDGNLGAGGSGIVIIRYAVSGSLPVAEKPTVNGNDVEPTKVLEVANSERTIVYPTEPEVTGEVGAQQIVFGTTTVDVPTYYTATKNGNTVSLALNANAIPAIAASTAAGEEKKAFEVTDDTVSLHLENVYAALYYTLQKATALGASADWTAVETKQGAADFTSERTSGDGYYRIVVTDVAPEQ